VDALRASLRLVFFLMLWSISGMSSRVVLPLLMAMLLTGCEKSPESSRPIPVSTEPIQGERTDGAPAREQTDARHSNASEAALNAALAEMTQVLRKYSFEHQRVPKTIGEVFSAGYMKTMPQAPPGKRFGIDPKTVQVVLVKQ